MKNEKKASKFFEERVEERKDHAIRDVNSMIDKVFSLYVDISVIDEKQRSWQ